MGEPKTIELWTEGEPVRLRLRRSARARRTSLSLHAVHGPTLTLPRNASLDAALAFVRTREAWLRVRLDARPEPRPFAEDIDFPLRGAPTRIVRRDGRGTVEASEGAVIVRGPPDRLAATLERWLRREARRDLEAAVTRHAGRLGASPKDIAVRDTTSRWGSCASSGRLSFCWRLVLAPPSVLSYVAAHEVAHLLEMNHSPDFWAIVERLDPCWRDARDWLRANGHDLHAVGRAG